MKTTNFFFSLVLAYSVQAATVTLKDVIRPEASRISNIPSYSYFFSLSEVGIKTESGGSAETTYIEEIRESQGLQRVTGTSFQGVPLNTTYTFHITRVQSSNGFWNSQDIPFTITSDGVTVTTTEARVQTCSAVEGGKYGCVEHGPLRAGPHAETTTYTNTALDVVLTEVGELKTDNNAATGSTTLMIWQMVVVCGGIIVGALVTV